MKLHQLRAALAVADKGSLRAAARALGLSQPALTHNIGELERELGAPLFERHSHGMTPTPVGQLFLRRAQVIDSETQRAHDEVAQFLGGDQGSVVVCLSIVAHLVLVPTALPLFRQRFPRVHVKLMEASFPAVESRLRDGSVDFFIGPAPTEPVSREFVQERLFDNSRRIYARNGHPLAQATSLAQLTDADWVVTGVSADAEHQLRATFERRGLPPPRVVAHAESMLSLMMAVMSSDLLALTLRQYGEVEPTRHVLHRLQVKESLPAPRIVLMRRAATPLTPAGDCFADMFRRASVDYVARAPAT